MSGNSWAAGSTIGANVSVTHSIPPRSLVYHEYRQLTIGDQDKRGGGMDEGMNRKWGQRATR
jgi:hypothetical protein